MGPHHIENFRACEYRCTHEGTSATGCLIGRASFCGPEQGRPCHFGMTFDNFPAEPTMSAADSLAPDAAYYGLAPGLFAPPQEAPEQFHAMKKPDPQTSTTPARVLEWREFSRHMEAYIADNTVKKYGDKGQDPMTDTDAHIIHWNLRRYATRLFRGFGKPHDLEKIAHYAAMAWAKKETK